MSPARDGFQWHWVCGVFTVAFPLQHVVLGPLPGHGDEVETLCSVTLRVHDSPQLTRHCQAYMQQLRQSLDRHPDRAG